MEKENNGTSNSEPVLKYGGYAAVVGAILSLLVSFGLDISDEQVRAVLALVASLAPFAPFLLKARDRVTPTNGRGGRA